MSQGTRPEDARLPAVQDGAAPEAGVFCGAKRIRSLYLPWMTGVTFKLSTTTPPKGLASFSTINAATMRLCRADLPASASLDFVDVLDPKLSDVGWQTAVPQVFGEPLTVRDPPFDEVLQGPCFFLIRVGAVQQDPAVGHNGI